MFQTFVTETPDLTLLPQRVNRSAQKRVYLIFYREWYVLATPTRTTNISYPDIKSPICKDEAERFLWRIQKPCITRLFGIWTTVRSVPPSWTKSDRNNPFPPYHLKKQYWYLFFKWTLRTILYFSANFFLSFFFLGLHTMHGKQNWEWVCSP